MGVVAASGMLMLYDGCVALTGDVVGSDSGIMVGGAISCSEVAE